MPAAPLAVLVWIVPTCFGVGELVQAAVSSTQSAPVASPATATQAGPRSVRFRPGVLIDYRERQVEVDAALIPHPAPLEVFACTPDTKEHETVLRVHARAEDIYAALGLIGILPGRPVRWDRANERFSPPTGDRVDALVRMDPGGESEPVPAAHLLRSMEPERSVPDVQWVFAGSSRYEDGMLAADAEGVVVALVNFESALLALPDSYSDDNRELWLGQDAEAMPDVERRVTLLLRPAAMRLAVEADDRLTEDGKPVGRQTLLETIRRRVRQDPWLRVRLTAATGISPDGLEKWVEALVAAGVQRSRISVARGPTSRPSRAE